MPKFILIEQSLRSLGGHHFEYAVEILRAAEASGYQPVLATNRDFRQRDRCPANWLVTPVFPYRSDRIHRVPKAASLAIGRRLLESGPSLGGKFAATVESIIDRFKSRISAVRWRKRKLRVAGFAAACHQLFRQVPIQSGDQVYCSTVSDMDLIGLVEYLKCDPASEQADWHLQFHFGVFSGRDPQYAQQQGNVRSLRKRFSDAVAELPRHQLYFYTTTDELGRQFNRLEAANFHTLPWPVGNRFHADTPHGGKMGDPNSSKSGSGSGEQSIPIGGSDKPLRLVCAGGVRREKGGDLVGPLIRSLDDEFLQTNKVQLLLQTGKKRKIRSMLGLESGSLTEIESFDPANLPATPVVSLPHPLVSDEYVKLIRSSDIGLLLYDSDEYFVRCSGILVELLAAGIPVIGPAGCWLGEQIDNANLEYLNGLLDRSTVVRHLEMKSMAWWSTGRQRSRIVELAVAEPAADLLLRLAPLPPPAAGVFRRVRLEQFAGNGKKMAIQSAIVGAAAEGHHRGGSAIRLFHLEYETQRIRISIDNPYENAPPPASPVEAFLINDAAGEVRHQPLGQVGLTMSSPECIPVLLRDLVAYYGHYRAAAREFSLQWREEHAPARTIEKITGSAASARQAAFRPAG